MLVYLCGPMEGIPANQVLEWREQVKTFSTRYVNFLDPCRGAGIVDDRVIEQGPFPALHFIEKDLFDVRRADLIFSNLTYTTSVSHGSAFEIAYAYALAKPILVVAPRDNNLANKAFIEHATTWRFYELEPAIEYLNLLATTE